MKFLLTLSVCILCCIGANAQTRSFTIARAATVDTREAQDEWNAILQESDEEVQDEHQNPDQLNILKQDLLENLHPEFNKASALRDVVDTPYLWKGLQAQGYNGSVPNDNDIAVSAGYLISVMNTNLFSYDLTADTSLGIITLQGFSTPLNNTHSKYDPKAMYDPDQNKFIVVFLAGFSSSASDIIVAFSQTENPGGTWNLYSLPGNPLGDSLWSDYPSVALTNKELFITVNHLADNESWQTGWRRSVIWQVNKNDGFTGDSLHTQLHYDINYNSDGIRNLCPVKGGSHLYGADMYFLSQRNLDISNDTFFLVHITDTMNAASQELTVKPVVSDACYFVPINAKQPSVNDLATNDSRVLGAFYENDRIQFVGNTTDTLTATAAFYHGVMKDVTTWPAIQLHTISDDSICYGYPNIAYAGTGSSDNHAIIGVLRSSEVLFPGYSAIATDGEGSYSAEKNVKDGLSYHSAINGVQRWGDYTGAQRDYILPGVVWVNGSYGLTNHKMSTWVSQLAIMPPPAGVPVVNNNIPQFSLYPNPSMQNLNIQFRAHDYAVCNFEIYDMGGKMIKLLMNEKISPGNNKFNFSTNPLPAGEYVLRISSNSKLIAAQKFIRQ